MNTMTMYYDGNFGLVMYAIADKVIGKQCSIEEVVQTCQPFISERDADDIERLFSQEYPAEFHWEEPAANKEYFILRGNNPTICADFLKIAKTLNKEERNNHVLTFSVGCFMLFGV